MQQSFSRSLANLQTDYVDSLVMHSPMPSHQDTMAVWRAMEEFAAAGQARQLGISNIYDQARLQQLFEESKVKPSVVQNRFYPRTNYDRGVRLFCR